MSHGHSRRSRSRQSRAVHAEAARTPARRRRQRHLWRTQRTRRFDVPALRVPCHDCGDGRACRPTAGPRRQLRSGGPCSKAAGAIHWRRSWTRCAPVGTSAAVRESRGPSRRRIPPREALVALESGADRRPPSHVADAYVRLGISIRPTSISARPSRWSPKTPPRGTGWLGSGGLGNAASRLDRCSSRRLFRPGVASRPQHARDGPARARPPRGAARVRTRACSSIRPPPTP